MAGTVAFQTLGCRLNQAETESVATDFADAGWRIVADGETADVLAFHHTRPFWPVHIVVIPKKHTPSLVDLGTGGEERLLSVMRVVREIAAQVLEKHGACRVLTNLGEYQDSKHLHYHVCCGEPLRKE